MFGRNKSSFLSRLSPEAGRRVVVVLSAALTFVAFDLFVRRAEPALKSYEINSYEQRAAAITHRPFPEVLLLGSSRSKYALVPDEFHLATGMDAYNYGIAGSKVAEWQLLIRNMLQSQRPRLVVLGVNASEFRADYTPAQAARHLFDWQDLADTAVNDGPSLDVLGSFARRKLAPLWATYNRSNELRMWAEERLADYLPKQAQLAREIRDRAAKPMTPDGYEHPWALGKRLKSVEEQLLANPVAVDTASIPLFSPDAPAYRRFGELLDWLRAREISVIVAYLPNSPRTEHRWVAVEPRMIDAIAEVCRAHGTPFTPCDQSDLPRTNRDYLDETHVGYDLARQISRRIAEQALAMNLVPGQSPAVAESAIEPENQP